MGSRSDWQRSRMTVEMYGLRFPASRFHLQLFAAHDRNHVCLDARQDFCLERPSDLGRLMAQQYAASLKADQQDLDGLEQS